MKVAILGMGYVGLVTANLIEGCSKVLGVETNNERLKELLLGNCPIYEPGLEERLRKNIAKETIEFANKLDPSESYAAVFVCVNTPTEMTGGLNLQFVENACRDVYLYSELSGHVPLLCIRSTVEPGTTQRITEKLQNEFPFLSAIPTVFLPEFLREATALKDFYDPARFVVGSNDPQFDTYLLEVLFKSVIIKPEVVETTIAEMIKMADNSFHALKIVFANEIGDLCSHYNVNKFDLMALFVKDKKLNISPSYLRPGAPYGGSCLPKDVLAINYLASKSGSNNFLLKSIIASNERFLDEIVEKVEGFQRPLFIGMTFKVGTDDLRNSPPIEVIRKLRERKYTADIAYYDPICNISGDGLHKVGELSQDDAKRYDVLVVFNTYKENQLAIRAHPNIVSYQ